MSPSFVLPQAVAQPPRSSVDRSRPRSSLLWALAVGLGACNGSQAPAGGLLNQPAGLALVNTLLFVSNQGSDELHVFDTQTRAFRPSPNLLFPLSIPTVRRPAAICSDAQQVFVLSNADPRLAVIDALDLPDGGGDPAQGLRELGEMALPALGADVTCTVDPAQVLAYQISVAGSPQAYAQQLDAGTLDGGAERAALAKLSSAALITLNSTATPCMSGSCPGTQIWVARNNYFGGPSCDGGTSGVGSSFCPSLEPLLALPPQPPSCQPFGPPLARRLDASGSNAGQQDFGSANVDPYTVNRALASDAHSNCVAAINLSDLSVQWWPANGSSTGVFSMPYVPGIGLAGGDLFAATLDSSSCERRGPEPVAGYQTCNGVSFLSLSQGGLLPEPLAYPFTPRHALPPILTHQGIVQRVVFLGKDLLVGGFSSDLPNPVPIEALAVAGDINGDMVFIDIGYGRPNGGTGSSDAGEDVLDFSVPPAYLAPRVLDINDYVEHPTAPQVLTVEAIDQDGGQTLGETTQQTMVTGVFTASGTELPVADRLNNPFTTPLADTGLPLPQVACFTVPTDAGVCITTGFVQRGAANDEAWVITFGGDLPGLGGAPADLAAGQLAIAGLPDLTQIDNGLLVSEAGNLSVELAGPDGGICGEFGLSATTAGSLTVSPQAGAACADGPVYASVFASGAKPYTVVGTNTGFIPQLWPADGTLHLVPTPRWHYPADLIAMEHSAQQLVDLVFGPTPTSPAPGSTLSAPQPLDSLALDSSFGLALQGQLGLTVGDGGAVQRGYRWNIQLISGVAPLVVNPASADALIEGMAAFTDTADGGTPHIYGSFYGGSGLVEVAPSAAYALGINDVH